MRFLYYFICICLFFLSPVFGALETDTHIYILAQESNCVVAINRTTGKETYIDFELKIMDMQLYKNNLYVVLGYGFVAVIDLATHKKLNSFNICKNSGFVQMVIHKDCGYILNISTNMIHIVDLVTNKPTSIIKLSLSPQKMFLYKDRLYVQGDAILVVDLTVKKEVKIITIEGVLVDMVLCYGYGIIFDAVDNGLKSIHLDTYALDVHVKLPECCFKIVKYNDYNLFLLSIFSRTIYRVDPFFDLTDGAKINHGKSLEDLKIKDKVGYIGKDIVTVFDVETLQPLATFHNPFLGISDFSDTHLYADRFKIRPLYPTIEVVKKLMQREQLRDFVTLMPKVFEAGDMMRRLVPTRDTVFDTLPPYVVMDTLADWQDPRDVLSVLVTMKNPKKLVDSLHGKTQMMPKVYTALFQAVWTGDQKRARQMILDLIRLEDPVITPLAKYMFTMSAGLNTGMKGARGKESTGKG